MAIKDFELYHGAVITKLLRKDKPFTLTLIETNKLESWSAYKIATDNKDAILYMKYCSAPKTTKKHTRWQYIFIKEHLRELKKYENDNIFLALIGVQRNIKDKPMEICLLKKDEIIKCIDINSEYQQSVSVYCEPRKKLRVVGTRINKDEIKVERSRLEKIEDFF